MFVGDSISSNQWGSMVCLLHNAVKGSNITSRTDKSTSTVTFQDYDVSIIVFNSHYLVDIENETVGRVLKLGSLKNGGVWKEMDVLVFNTWLWWYRRGDQQPWDYVEVEGKIVKDVDRMVAFREGLNTWAKWVSSDVDPVSSYNAFKGMDCTHWCVAGVLDSWNHLLYARLVEYIHIQQI
ncbi:protein trichome birefringence-like 39 [Primulina tabacum]|uniref:protein trichome birefringence-like 39 n=1 Tax=Primulina tabacum TaxID=48773 RepID=UPI003F59447C